MAPKTATEQDRMVGERITALRRAKGLSQASLGTAVGVTFQQVQKYESGLNRIGASRLQDIAKFLKVPVASLFGDDAESSKETPLISLVALPGAVDLLKAFAKIDNPELRRNVIAIVSSAARISTAPVAGNG